MKRFLVAIMLVGPIVLAAAGLAQANKPTPPSTAAADTGRYQIVSGTYRSRSTSGGKNFSEDEQAVFRIDTQTGRTWVFRELVTDDEGKRSFTGWVAAEELSKPK